MHHRLHIHTALAAAACGALLLFPPQAWAQPLDPVSATELFSQGRDAMKDGDANRACPLFAESNRLDPKVGTLMNLGECEEQRGHFAEAMQAWQQAMNLAEATNDARREVAAERLARLTPRVPRLTVRIARDSPPGTRVFRDSVELGAVMLGRPIPIDPGAHRIDAIGPDGAKRSFHVNVKEGDAAEVTVTVGAAAPAAATSADPGRDTPAPPTTKRTLAYALGAVGIVGVATGIVTGAMLMSKRSTVDDHCGDDGACDPTGVEAADAGKTLVPINTVAWVVGAVGLGAGTYLFVTSAPQPPQRTATQRSPWTSAVLQVTGTF